MPVLNKPQYKVIVNNTINIFKTIKATNTFIKDYCFNNDFNLIRNTYIDTKTISYNLRNEGEIVLSFEKIHYSSELTTL